jgi:uncharacterized protein HemY
MSLHSRDASWRGARCWRRRSAKVFAPAGLQGQASRVACLSEVCRLAGCGAEAWHYAHQALDLARQLKERGNEARALHQLGIMYVHTISPDAPQAVTYYQQALALADELSMRPLVAHCHSGLGTLYAATGQRAQARTAPARCRGA